MKVHERLRSFVSFFKELSREFDNDNSLLMAAAVSFYSFLALVPLLLLAAAGLSYALGSQERAYQTVIDHITQYAPQLAIEQRQEIRDLVGELIRGRSAATGIGIIVLIWSGLLAFLNLSKVINLSFDAPLRSFFRNYLVAFGLMIAVGLLLIISFVITTAAAAVKSYDLTLFGQDITALFGWAWSVLIFFLPLCVTIATFTLLYKVAPNKKVDIKSAFIGGLCAGIFWEGAKFGFAWYVTSIANYSAVYGPIAGIILLLLWIYYSSIVSIIGAQIAAIYQRRHLPEQV